MDERALELKVGLLVTISLALLVGFVVTLGNFRGGDGVTLYVDVPTSASLSPGATVKVAGVAAGKVRDVAFWGGREDPATGRRVTVRVELSVDRDKLASLGTGARFFITSQGVLGEKYVEVDPGPFDAPRLEEGAVLVGEPPVRLEIMVQEASELLRRVHQLVRDNQEGLTEAVANANDMMRAARQAADRVDRMVARAEPKVNEGVDRFASLAGKADGLMDSAQVALGDGQALRRTVAHVEALAREARGQLGPLARSARDALAKFGDLADGAQATMAGLQDKLDRAVGDVGALVADARAVMADVRAGKGTIGALLNDREMFDDVREMMADLKLHPWKFLWKE